MGMKGRHPVIKPYKGFIRTKHTRSLPMKLTGATSSQWVRMVLLSESL